MRRPTQQGVDLGIKIVGRQTIGEDEDQSSVIEHTTVQRSGSDGMDYATTLTRQTRIQ
ncbi:hypothetical protein D3C80_2164650 [compost metagenome]